MTADPWLQVIDELRALIRLGRQISHRHVAIYEGLQSATVAILGLLIREGGLRLTTVAERQCVDISVASRQVAELVERSLVERVPDDEDARAQLLIATDDGHALADRVHQRQANLAAEALRDWNTDDLHALVGTLAKLNADLRTRFASQHDTTQSDALTRR